MKRGSGSFRPFILQYLEEAREILRSALSQSKAPQENITEAIRRSFAPFGGVELPVIERACLVGKSALP